CGGIHRALGRVTRASRAAGGAARGRRRRARQRSVAVWTGDPGAGRHRVRRVARSHALRAARYGVGRASRDGRRAKGAPGARSRHGPLSEAGALRVRGGGIVKRRNVMVVATGALVVALFASSLPAHASSAKDPKEPKPPKAAKPPKEPK